LLAAQGAHVVSTDEKTGIQALERLHPTKPTRPGLTERREFEYKRHGTLCLIANFDVVTGEAILPTVGPTRTEEDFANHINQTVDADPNGTWVFVVDQLNTHKSEALVCYTPRHASWLNQVELWFSILARRALKRASFTSVDDLRQRLLAFIEYFNAVLAKPFRWTYSGKPLHA